MNKTIKTMDAKELMIGNYVLIKKNDFEDLLESLDLEPNDYIPKDPIFEICSIEKKQVRIQYFDEFEFDYSQIEPIPLTEQWLIDFGFELKDPINRGYLISTRESLKEYLYCSKNGTIASYSELLETPQDFVYNRIKFIHSLQNFYFALTGKQLTK